MINNSGGRPGGKDISQSFVNFPLDERKGVDRKSVGSKTAATAMTSSNGSALNSMKINEEWDDVLGFPSTESFHDSMDSDNDDMIRRDEFAFDESAAAAERRSRSQAPHNRHKHNSRTKSEPRNVRNQLRHKKPSIPEGKSFDPIVTPASSRRYRSAITDPRRSGGRRSRGNGTEMENDRYFSSDRYFPPDRSFNSDRHFSSDTNSRYSHYTRSRVSGGTPTSSRISRGESRHLKNNGRYERYNYNKEFDDFKEHNYKNDFDDDFTNLLSALDDEEDPEISRNEKISKVLSKLSRKNGNLENENLKLKNSLRSLSRSAHRQDDAMGFYRMKEQEYHLDLKEKDDIILLLEREKDELRHFLLESQLEVKVLKKKCEIYRNKVTDLEHAFSMQKSRIAQKPDKVIVVDSKNENNDEGTVSSLEV